MKFNVGDEVVIMNSDWTNANYRGDKGIIAEIDPRDGTCRVQVEGRAKIGNWSPQSDLKLIHDKKQAQ